ncbi:Alpha/Beta hydrolase protein [Crepidotus variabilis]|uniref:Alpha/Beta hydrolase protein n=1 Tax=Crepidotus variabilis TaxID=179855 RepID=A0A9P6EKV2_9AGAR|nr:Alpha/Beta hydrolase protein [Crepidotus variabilis]
MLSTGRLLALSSIVALVRAGQSTFNPLDHNRLTATCKAIRRGTQEAVVDIQLKYVDINLHSSTTMIMVHGWPSLWSSWGQQIESFKNDYRLIAPDLRGFGQSTHPGNPETSGSLADMVGDLVCILEHAKVSSAICMGHDWGSTVCYEAARRRPDIFTAVVGIVVPYISAARAFIPTREFGSMFETLRYQAFFDTSPTKASKELSHDIRRTLRATLRTASSPPPKDFLKSNDSFLDAWSGVKDIPSIPFFSSVEEEYFISQYELHGFGMTFQFYANENRLLNWESSRQQGNYTIPQPVLAVYPTQDPVADWVKAAEIMKSSTFLPRLTVKTMPGSHWPHIEKPGIFNMFVRDWLAEHREARTRRTPDEL